MERLTASPRITDIYGFCGVTSILEPLPYEGMYIMMPDDFARLFTHFFRRWKSMK